MNRFSPSSHDLLNRIQKLKSFFGRCLISQEHGMQMNLVNSPFFRKVFLTAAFGVFPFVGVVSSEELPPPKYETIDRYGVNVATGKVSVSNNDISIGGSLGLSHTISTYSSDFANYGSDFDGYNESFRGGVMKVIHTKGLKD